MVSFYSGWAPRAPGWASIQGEHLGLQVSLYDLTMIISVNLYDPSMSLFSFNFRWKLQWYMKNAQVDVLSF